MTNNSLTEQEFSILYALYQKYIDSIKAPKYKSMWNDFEDEHLNRYSRNCKFT